MIKNRLSGMLASLAQALYIPARVSVYVLAALALCGLVIGMKGCWHALTMTK